MTVLRRDLLKYAGSGFAIAAAPLAAGATTAVQGATGLWLSVRNYGATGDGKTIDSPAINRAIEAAAVAGGGTVLFPAGVYASYSIHLRSHVTLYLDSGATILAASVPLEGTTNSGYDAAEPQDPAVEAYQDYGHNHWHNSLMWGEGIHDVAILGPGLIWGKGLSRGDRTDTGLPDATKPGVGNKAIALKHCYNVILRDFSILQGGWFGILATGVDNLTIDNLKIDTNRDGMDIDCCRNVRVSNCTVNSPWDDGICPKSSYALGYARPTENVTITNCYVTAGYQLGSVLDGTWKKMPPGESYGTGRIKCGTESNGGFRNITISSCVFEDCKGLALETEDGARIEDITVTNITMRGLNSSPLFLRLGSRMRGPAGGAVGILKRVLLSNITSSAAALLPSILSGIPGHKIEDIQISDVYLEQVGGASEEMVSLHPPEKEASYPDPDMFGPLPATGFFLRHIRNLVMSNVEVVTLAPDRRAAFCLSDVEDADFFRVRVPKGAPAYDLRQVTDFRSFGSRGLGDVSFGGTETRKI